MAKVALIQPDGRVAQVCAASEQFDVHEGLRWVPAPDEAFPDMRFSTATGFGPRPVTPPVKRVDLAALLVAKGLLTATDF